MTDSAPPPPPPPPPHGQNPRTPGGLPDGNYDIFIVPPHSAGAGFLYLPSLQTQRNSFIAGIAVALAGVGIYVVVTPVLQAWLHTVMAGNAWGVLILVVIVGVGAWAIGKTNAEYARASFGASGPSAGPQPEQQRSDSWGPGPVPGTNPPPPQGAQGAGTGSSQQQQQQQQGSSAQTGWEKAREETKKREEARKRVEEFERKRAEAAKAREEAANAAKAKAEKEKWEQARAREKEQREREARERLNNAKTPGTPDKDARAQSIRERMEKLRREREEKEKQKAASSPSATGRTSPKKEYVRPTARSAVGTEDQYSYRPYDTPPKPRAPFQSSASSVSGLSESSYAASQTTAQTTPPPASRGPYSTQDPDKIQIRAVYLFKDSWPGKPVASLVVGQNSVSDGLILHIGTEGLFIDDDVRKVPQREWDVKAWTLKLVEDGGLKGGAGGYGLHVLRATVRNADSSKYIFVFDETEGWKISKGLERLRKGSQTRSLGTSGMKEMEVKSLLGSLGWI